MQRKTSPSSFWASQWAEVNSTTSQIPEGLKGKFPPALGDYFLDLRGYGVFFGLGFTVMCLHGPIISVVGPADCDGYRYLLGSFLCPAIPTLFGLLRPINPYRGRAAQMAGMVGLDEQDPDASRLVKILRSRASRRFLLLTQAKFTAVLLLVMTVSAVIHWKSLHWSWKSSEDLAAIILVGAIGCLLAIFGEHLRWAVRTWVKTSHTTDDLVEPAQRFGPKR